MRCRHWMLLLFASLLGWPLESAAATSPQTFLGFPVGADRKLADYGQIVRYFETLDRESPRLALQKLGKTTLGRDLVMAVISSERNIQETARGRTAATRAADPRALTEADQASIAEKAPVVVLVTCNIHSSEIGASQMAMEWALRLCTSQDPKVLRWLDDVVLLLMPSINPDGTDMIVDYYRKYVGTEWEGGRLPWIYHHYAGHDNNRDWFMLNLDETRMVNRVLHHDWFPQVFLDMHQMGAAGPRIFVPPYADPVTPMVHPLQWRINDVVGTQMGLRLEQAGKSGVINSWSYDAYWPGGTKNTACLKNVIGLLTEVSSCRIASPVYVDPNELQGGRKGLPDYRQQSNFPNPWRGGWWRLRDIIDYELIAGDALLDACSTYRREILEGEIEMARDAVRRGRQEAPYAYVVPADQHDPQAARELVSILRENGLECARAPQGFTTSDGRSFPAGSMVFLAAQPYRGFLIEMMERQRYPEVRQGTDSKEIFRPYDVTAWTLPLMMGVSWARIDKPFETELVPLRESESGEGPAAPPSGGAEELVIPCRTNASYRAVNLLLARGVKVERALGTPPTRSPGSPAGDPLSPGDFIVPAAAAKEIAALPERHRPPIIALPSKGTPRAGLQAPRLGLYRPWTASIDEGWTRLILDRYEFKYASLDNAAMKQKNLRARFDAIILPDVEKNVIVEGKPRSEDGGGYFEPLPPPYAGGIGKDGVAALKTFVEEGGTLICLTSSSDLAIDEFNIPVRNTVAKAKSSEFSLPGTLVNLEVDPAHPLAWGMGETCAAYVTGGPVFATNIPGARVDRSVAARYPTYADQVVASGWADGTELMTGRAAIVEARLGKGRVVMFGPRVQHRAQMVGTFKFLFNAIFEAGLKESIEVPRR